LIFDGRKKMAKEAGASARRLALGPLAEIEVEGEVAELMGAFEETAVSLGDVEACEPGSLDWLLEPGEAGPAKGGGRGRK
jgi:hypothetical protein